MPRRRNFFEEAWAKRGAPPDLDAALNIGHVDVQIRINRKAKDARRRLRFDYAFQGRRFTTYGSSTPNQDLLVEAYRFLHEALSLAAEYRRQRNPETKSWRGIRDIKRPTYDLMEWFIGPQFQDALQDPRAWVRSHATILLDPLLARSES